VRSAQSDSEMFEAHRPSLRALAYRMLGDVGRAEDAVQESWLRWQRRAVEVDAPKAYLIQTVTRVCLNELNSAKSRKEESRGDRLPEPVDLNAIDFGRVDLIDQISMAFLVALQKLTPAERAVLVLVLHDVFDFSHAEVARTIDKSEDACRQLLRRAKRHINRERPIFAVTKEEHQELLHAFLAAASSGNVSELADLLATDVTLTVDAGPNGGHFGRVRNLPGPLVGAAKVAAFVSAVTPQGSGGLSIQFRELHGQPAALILRDEDPVAAITVCTAHGKILAIFMQADHARLSEATQIKRTKSQF